MFTGLIIYMEGKLGRIHFDPMPDGRNDLDPDIMPEAATVISHLNKHLH